MTKLTQDEPSTRARGDGMHLTSPPETASASVDLKRGRPIFCKYCEDQLQAPSMTNAHYFCVLFAMVAARTFWADCDYRQEEALE